MGKSAVEGGDLLNRGQQALITTPAVEQMERATRSNETFNAMVAKGAEAPDEIRGGLSVRPLLPSGLSRARCRSSRRRKHSRRSMRTSMPRLSRPSIRN